MNEDAESPTGERLGRAEIQLVASLQVMGSRYFREKGKDPTLQRAIVG